MRSSAASDVYKRQVLAVEPTLEPNLLVWRKSTCPYSLVRTKLPTVPPPAALASQTIHRHGIDVRLLGVLHPIWSFLHSESPSLETVGPSVTKQANPVTPNLQNWLDDMKQQDLPVVYVALGTMIQLTPERIRQLEAQLSEMKDTVAILWSLKEESHGHLAHQNIPPTWRIESFCPQVSLFRSGRIATFVTHCGSNSVAEALLEGVPMICCPFFADQPANALRLARAGVGIVATSPNKKTNPFAGVAQSLRVFLQNRHRMCETSRSLG